MRYNPFLVIALAFATPLATFAQDQPRLVRLFLQPPQETSKDPAQPKLPASNDQASPASPPGRPAGADRELVQQQPDGHTWFDAEYQMWRTKKGSAPPLVVTGPSPAGNTALSINGTTTTTGPTFIPTSPGSKAWSPLQRSITSASTTPPRRCSATASTARSTTADASTLGGWLDNEQTFGVEVRYTFLLRSWATFSSGSANSVLAIPYQNAATGAETSYAINQPFSLTSYTRVSVNTTPDVFVGLFEKANFDGATGNVAIRNSSSLQMGEANGIWALSRSRNWNVDAIGGFRYVALDESLSIESTVHQQHLDQTVYNQSLGLPAGFTPIITQYDALVSRIDLFETRNRFYGGQLGLSGKYDWGRFFLVPPAAPSAWAS